MQVMRSWPRHMFLSFQRQSWLENFQKTIAFLVSTFITILMMLVMHSLFTSLESSFLFWLGNSQACIFLMKCQFNKILIITEQANNTCWRLNGEEQDLEICTDAVMLLDGCKWHSREGAVASSALRFHVLLWVGITGATMVLVEGIVGRS